MRRRIAFETAVRGRVGQPGALGIGPAGIDAEAGGGQIRPIKEERDAESDELGEELRRERHHGHYGEEQKVQPAQIAIRALELVELGMLADPERPERQDAHQPGDDARGELAERGDQLPLAVDFPRLREVHAQHEDRHRHPEYAVTEIGDATDIARRDLVEVCFHVAVS